jgi:two-component system response regulator GlrR
VSESKTPVTRLVKRDGREVRLINTYTVESLAADGPAVVLHVASPLFTVGSHPSNDLVLADSTVSKHHLEIAIAPEGYRIVDLGSSNGTFAGAMRIDGVTVVEPLTLRLGASTLRLTPTHEEVELPASPRTQFGSLLGRSAVMRELFGELELVAKSDSWVLIEGETGAGKEQVAESIHRQSGRAGGPFVVVDCGALVPGLVEAELFGHVRGAFSGAERERQGLLESADGGTLFLDEIGDLPPPLQSSVLGALGRKKVTPIGSSTARAIDVRVIAATHRNLGREVNEGRFRPDLFYRLAVLRVRVPPLRDRIEDIPLLVEHFLAELRTRRGAAVPAELSAIVMARLSAERWPGNVRELRNAVERAALSAIEDAGEERTPVEPGPFVEARTQFIEEFGRTYLTELLARCGYNVSEAARRAGVERKNFARLLERHHVDRRPGQRRR